MGFQWEFQLGFESNHLDHRCLVGYYFESVSGDESPTDMVRKPSNLSNMVSPLDGGARERQVMSTGQID